MFYEIKKLKNKRGVEFHFFIKKLYSAKENVKHYKQKTTKFFSCLQKKQK